MQNTNTHTHKKKNEKKTLYSTLLRWQKTYENDQMKHIRIFLTWNLQKKKRIYVIIINAQTKKWQVGHWTHPHKKICFIRSRNLKIATHFSKTNTSHSFSQRLHFYPFVFVSFSHLLPSIPPVSYRLLGQVCWLKAGLCKKKKMSRAAGTNCSHSSSNGGDLSIQETEAEQFKAWATWFFTFANRGLMDLSQAELWIWSIHHFGRSSTFDSLSDAVY